MTDVPAKLDTLIDELTRLGSPIRDYLVPGRSAAAVRASLEQFGLFPTEELLDWFRWHDG